MSTQLKHDEDKMELPFVETGTKEFLTSIMNNIKNTPSTRVRIELMKAAQKFLIGISESDASIGGAAVFLSSFIKCQLIIQKILEEKFSPLSNHEPNSVFKLLQISLQ